MAGQACSSWPTAWAALHGGELASGLAARKPSPGASLHHAVVLPLSRQDAKRGELEAEIAPRGGSLFSTLINGSRRRHRNSTGCGTSPHDGARAAAARLRGTRGRQPLLPASHEAACTHDQGSHRRAKAIDEGLLTEEQAEGIDFGEHAGTASAAEPKASAPTFSTPRCNPATNSYFAPTA